jgi:HrpA-like RNA helicase
MAREAADLPISGYASEIKSLVKNHSVTIITGEPGSGKTTQLPQMLLDDSQLFHKLRVRRPRVVVTQPRRVAAVAMAERVAWERRGRLGKEVR